MPLTAKTAGFDPSEPLEDDVFSRAGPDVRSADATAKSVDGVRTLTDA